MRQWFYIKYQMSSWLVTFYSRPLILTATHLQGSKIALVRSYLRVPQAAGQVKFWYLLMKITIFPIYSIIFVMQGKCLF